MERIRKRIVVRMLDRSQNMMISSSEFKVRESY